VIRQGKPVSPGKDPVSGVQQPPSLFFGLFDIKRGESLVTNKIKKLVGSQNKTNQKVEQSSRA